MLVVTVPKNWRGGQTSKFILWGQHYPITKPEKVPPEKKSANKYPF
jgi:hypothetical protein